MEFKAGDPNTLLLVGLSEDPLASIYEIGVTRDAQGHITGFSGVATIFLGAPNASGGLRYGPGGVLFYTTYPTNTLAQFKPGSIVPDKVVNLSLLGIAASTGGLDITPSGFPGAGEVKITSYDASFWYSANLVLDGNGTYDVTNVALSLPPMNGSGSESIVYVDSTYPAFTNQSVLISEWTFATVSAYEIDAGGNPIVSTRRIFLDGLTYMGSALDPVTGDFLFSDWGAGDQVLVAQPLVTPLGMNFCISTVNSTGSASTISATGSASLAANDLVLSADNLPSQPGIFIAGPGQAQIPFFNGFLCIATGGLQRFLNTTAPTGGVITEAVDYGTSVPGGLAVVAGSSYNYQRWNRDPLGGGGNANFSDGIEISHTP